VKSVVIVEPVDMNLYKNVTKRNASVALAITRALLEEIDDRVDGHS
jgi:hypothetical protein